MSTGSASRTATDKCWATRHLRCSCRLRSWGAGPSPPGVAGRSLRVVRRRHRLRGAPVPSVEWRVVACLPGFAQTGLAEIPVRADLAGDGPQIVPEISEGGTSPEPIAVVDAVDDQSRLEHESVGDHGVVLGVGVLLDFEVL